MINAKKIINTILNDSRITAVCNKIFSQYPENVTTFPCIIFSDDGQNKIEYRDNKSGAVSFSFTVHVFSKKNLTRAQAICEVIDDVLTEADFICNQNTEVTDNNADVEHRVLGFRQEIIS